MHTVSWCFSTWSTIIDRAVRAFWRLADGSRLTLLANMGERTISDIARSGGRVLYHLSRVPTGDFENALPPWSVWWFLETNGGGRT